MGPPNVDTSGLRRPTESSRSTKKISLTISFKHVTIFLQMRFRISSSRLSLLWKTLLMLSRRQSRIAWIAKRFKLGSCSPNRSVEILSSKTPFNKGWIPEDTVTSPSKNSNVTKFSIARCKKGQTASLGPQVATSSLRWTLGCMSKRLPFLLTSTVLEECNSRN
jgi:hypothetical protein